MKQDFYERVEHMPWCSQCERWQEDCVCEELCDHFRETVGATGGEDVCVPALSPVPLQLDYPAWRLSFSAYGKLNGWEIPQ